MKVIIAGGRHFKPDLLWAILLMETVKDLKPTMLVCGGCRGADEMAVHLSSLCGIECVVFNADWDNLGKSAGPCRNRQMAEFGDALIAFPGGRGTQNMIDSAEEFGLPVYHLFPPEERPN